MLDGGCEMWDVRWRMWDGSVGELDVGDNLQAKNLGLEEASDSRLPTSDFL